MVGSPVIIPGKPTILLVDASLNLDGWEAGFCDRILDRLRRRDIRLKSGGPARVEKPEELAHHLEPQQEFNCILLLCHGEKDGLPQEAKLKSYWEWLNGYHWLSPKLFATCTWEGYDPHTSREILGASNTFAPLALTPLSPLTPREGGLFFIKFFTELDLHSGDRVSAGMVRFSYAKARHLLVRRHMEGQIGVRC